MPTQNFFVYGTLMAGEGNHRVSKQHDPMIQTATLTGGTVYGYGQGGGYPSINLDGTGMAVGELHSFPATSPVLLSMDCLEGYTEGSNHNLYERKMVTVSLADGSEVEAWVYHREMDDIKSHYGADMASFDSKRWNPRHDHTFIKSVKDA